MAASARIDLVETRGARPLSETVETQGLVLMAAAPVMDYAGKAIGVLYGGLLLNRRFEIVDKIKETLFRGVQYEGVDIGTATLFLDDVRVATNVLNEDGTRAIGTRVSEEVYERVVVQGERWLDRAYVVNDWYLTGYAPLREVDGDVVGMLYVGLLERPYSDLRTRSTWLFVAITLGGVALATAISIFISRRLSTPVRALVKASRRVAEGDLAARVSGDDARRDRRVWPRRSTPWRPPWPPGTSELREFARKRIMQSERLAVVGQLAADVAHELNNPLQGIVTYSHLLLERMAADDPKRASVEKIATQAARCATIIRALLDFSRPKKPQKKPVNLCAIVEECFSLVEDRAVFHNIEVVRDYADCLPDTVVDPAQIQQVLMNLIINAAEAMGGAGRLTVSTRFDTEREVVQVRAGRHRPRHPRGEPGADLRPLLHHQGGRARHRPGPGHQLRHRQRARRHHHRGERGGGGHDFHHRIASGEGGGGGIVSAAVGRILLIDDEEVVLDSCRAILEGPTTRWPRPAAAPRAWNWSAPSSPISSSWT